MHSADSLSLWWADLKTGAGLLTRLPFVAGEPDETVASRAVRVFPLIGALIGLAGGLAFLLADGLGLPALASGLLAVAATILVTGAFHEDGLADTADGFGGAFERERKLEIMRDSATGAYGTLALVLSVGLRGAALAALAEPGAALAALVAAHAASRSALPLVMFQMPLARTDGLAATARKPEAGPASIALALGAVITLLLLGLGAGLLIMIAAGLTAGAMALFAQAQIDGYTGDVLGAIQQLVEITILLGAAAAL